ncbi:MAG: hypothetical protein Q9183_005065 [Haloplaca sp. 2 TL-2023]
MGDPPAPKRPSIPGWQHDETSNSLQNPNTESNRNPHDNTEPPPPRALLLEQATKFLKEDDIKDAPQEKKVTFLQSKGLTKEEIHKLLDLPSEEAGADEKNDSVVQSSNSPTASRPQSETQPSQPEHSPPSLQPPQNDVAPIITYPEFLLHSQKPPPLVTASALTKALYLFSALSAAVYGTSKYIAGPMLDSLTAARSSLLETAQSNLDNLNERLEREVSVLPSGMPIRMNDHEDGKEDEEDDGSETTEDMAHLFNRTIGTQTSPLHSPSSSLSSLDASQQKPAPSKTATHESSLRSLKESLEDLIPVKEDFHDSGKEELDNLKRYLHGLTYPSWNTPEPKDDAVATFKTEVRGLKGQLLSARNFPAGPGRGTGRGV